MPEHPDPHKRPHPRRTPATARRRRRAAHRYAELQVTSNFTFLAGASHPEELVEQAAHLGHHAITVTDENTVAGIVRGHVAAVRLGMPYVVGARLSLIASDLPPDVAPRCPVLVYPTSLEAYGTMCRLLTIGRRRAPKGECHLVLHDLFEHHEGLLAVVVPPATLDQPFLEIVAGLQSCFDDDRLSLAASCPYGPDDRGRLASLASLAEHRGVPLVATNDVHYHVPQRRPLQHVLTCLRHGCTIRQGGFALLPNAERHLKTPEEMARLFARHPAALERTIEIADRAGAFSLDELRYQYPDEICPAGTTPMQHLVDLTWRGAHDRYPDGLPPRVRAQIEHEFTLIDDLQYAPYFLTVHDLVQFARGRGILCQGRGAAANSAVCYCLGVTSVDPSRINLLFERFVSHARNEPPDIDIDFEHERREEVIQRIYEKYGRDRAALTAEVITYRGRSAIREVGKALGLSLDCVNQLVGSRDWWDRDVIQADRVRSLGLDPDDPTIQHLFSLTRELVGFPRHLSQHVGGFVITRRPLCELVPIENAALADRTVIEWDKADIDAMGMLKVDVLGLGMLTCIRKCFELVEQHHGEAYTLATIPPDDSGVYDMICRADTVGVFQIESRAQMSMLPRLRPRTYYDLVIEVAIVRPGPIQGKMVHPYLRRRNGEEPVSYPDERVRAVLEKTLGVPLFQEQAMQLAMVAAGFTAEEADELRRTMASWKRKGNQLARFGSRLIEGMLSRGYPRAFAERCFEQIKGFSEYGFPESHAASFALLVYASCWLKHHYHAAFAAALLNSQPMGFYAPAQIVRDAREHDIEVRPVDVNHSDWDCTLEPVADDGVALRLGMRLVKGLREDAAHAVAEAARRHGPFADVDALRRRSEVSVATLRRLAAADAFASMGLDRQHAIWSLQGLRDDPLPLFDAADERAGTEAAAEPPGLPAIPAPRTIAQDYGATGLSLKAHPVAFLREHLDTLHVTPAALLADPQRCPAGQWVTVAGVVICRQHPSTASGITFVTLEDETGIANLIVRPAVFERDRRSARHGIVLLVRGRVERQGEVVHVLATRIDDLDHRLRGLQTSPRNFH
jgi:error-prone DNA polymerase